MTQAGPPAPVLLVTHDESVRTLVTPLLVRAGHGVVPAADGTEAVALLDGPALMVLDLRLPRRGAWAVLARAAASERPPVVVLVPRADYRTLARAIREGASATVFSPFRPDDVVAACQAALARGGAAKRPTERRRDARRIVVAEVSVLAADGAPLGPAELADLGAGGAQVRLPVRLEASTRVRLTLPVRIGNALAVDAIVQWNGRAPSGFSHGLRFVDLTLAQRRALCDLLDHPAA